MQTFLPYSNYSQCAKSLDNKRLNKQILECYQILNILSGQSKSSAWSRHPAVLMWEGAENELYNYTMAMVEEANIRGIKTDKNLFNINNLRDKCKSFWGNDKPIWNQDGMTLHKVNATHKVSLYNKDPEYYANFAEHENSIYNIPCCDKCKYYWPTHRDKNGR